MKFRHLYSKFYSPRSSSGEAGILNSSSGRRGQVIIEAVIAASVLTMGLVGMLSLLNNSLSLSRNISNSYIGTYLAAEGIEIVKNVIDTNLLRKCSWGIITNGDYEVDYASASPPPSCYSFAPYSGRALYFNSANHLYNLSGSGSPTNFTRRITITVAPPPARTPDEIRVNSVVTWTTRNVQSSVNVEDHFFNWRP